MFWGKKNTAILCAFVWLSAISFLQAATYTVTNLNDAGAGSLRDAISQANAVAGPHTINFSVTGTITLTSGNFANIGRQITINGGTLGNVVLNCNNNADFGFFFVDAVCVNSQIQNMVINNFRVHGIAIISTNVTGIRISNCRIGTNAAGTAAATVAGSVNGVVIDNSGGNFVTNCVISGCRAFGIQVAAAGADNNTFTGNILGLDATGTAAIPNAFSGIQLANGTDGNIIGGNSAATRNVISGNSQFGIQIVDGDNNTITGNYIGTNSAGSAAIGNALSGIQVVNNSDNNTFGGNNANLRNVISGNGNHAIQIVNTSINNKIYGNYIGCNAAGTAGLGNAQQGILIQVTSTGTEVGSATAGTGNVIVGSGFSGIYVDELCNNTSVKGNIIGLNAAGTAAIPNQQNGVSLAAASNCIVGGTTAAERNVVSGNGTADMGFGPNQFSGISASTYSANPCNNNQIIGNYVGVGSNGTTQLENGNHAIWLYNATATVIQNNITSINAGNTGAMPLEQNRSTIYIFGANAGTVVKGNTILRGRRSSLYMESVNGIVVGGTIAADRNLIQSAQQHGIEMINVSTSSIHGNSIGTDAAGTVDLGNTLNGIIISGNSVNNEIGGTAAGKPNKIAYNDNYGVAVMTAGSLYNPIRRNEIYCNLNRGIYLNSAGNENLAAPVVNVLSSLTNVYGTAGANATLDLYYTDPTCNPCSGGTQQGKTFIATVTANGVGDWSYTGGVTGFNITATQTNALTSTSEFSSCSALPVELLYFSATANANGTALLNWATASEINSNKFVLESSADGVTFETIGTVDAAGNSMQTISYSFVDQNPVASHVYYRIRMVDIDNSYAYSEVRSVVFENSLMYVFPNPNEGIVMIQTSSPILSVDVLTLTGQIVFTELPTQTEAATFTLNLSALSTGTYLLRVSTADGILYEKVVKK